MNNNQFEALFKSFQKVANKYLTGGMSYQKRIFTYPNGDIDYCIGFALVLDDGSLSFHQGSNSWIEDHYPVKVNDLKTVSALVNHIRYNYPQWCIVKEYKYIISREMKDEHDGIVKYFYWNGNSFVSDKERAFKYENTNIAADAFIGKYKQRMISSVPIF